MKLTPEQLEHFETEGYVVVEGALSDADLAPMRRGYTAFIDRRARELLAAGEITDLHEDEPFERRLSRLAEQYPTLILELDLMNSRVEEAFHFLRNDNLIDLIESLIGPEITCSPIQHTRPKMPSNLVYRGQAQGEAAVAAAERLASLASGYITPWHQDAQVHLEEADATFIVTVWLPLVDATPENGCLEVIPRVHHLKKIYWSKGFGISPEHMPPGEVITVPMKKGSVLLMHKLLPHGSGPNHSDDIRWSLDLRYQRTGTPTGRAYYPDFPVRSRAHPETVLTDYAEWNRRWVEALERSPRLQNQARPETPMMLEKALV